MTFYCVCGWITDWIKSEINTILTVHPRCMHTLALTHTHTLSFSLSWPGALVCVVLWLPKSSVDILKHGAVWMLFFPSFHNMMCFLFCVCFDPSLAAKLCCGGARVWVALLCYFWQQRWLVALEERGRQEGDGMKPPKNPRGCLRDSFCLEELLCDDQELLMDSMNVLTRVHVCSFSTSQTPHILVLLYRPHTHNCFIAWRVKC